MPLAEIVSDLRLAVVAAVDTAPTIVALTGRASGNIIPASSLDANEDRPLVTYDVTSSEEAGPGESGRITIRFATYDDSDSDAIALMTAVIARLTAPILATGTAGSPQMDTYVESSVGLDLSHPTPGESAYEHDLTLIAERMADAAELDVVTKVYGDSRYLRWGVPVPLIVAVDGGGLPLAAGSLPAIPIDLDCDIVGAELLGDQPGSADVRLWVADKSDHYPPVAGDDITAGTFLLSAAARQEYAAGDLTGFTTLALSERQALKPHIQSIDTLTHLTIKLLINRRTPE